VQNVSYTGVCMRGVMNPLVFDPYYSSTATGTQIPVFRNIAVHQMHMLGGGRLRLRGFDATRPLVLALDNVVFDSAPTVTAQDAQLTFGPDPVGITAAGTDVTVNDTVSGSAAPIDCTNAWVTF
jgi:polygalacturonase